MDKSCTIIIANHNYGNYITDAINSAKNQTYKSQITIIDDASTDDSWEKIITTLFNNQYTTSETEECIEATDGTNIAIKLKHQSGPSHARNIGIQKTIQTTDYYAILDADDILDSTKIEKCITILEKYPVVGIVYADYNILNVETNVTLTEFKEPFSHPRLLQECIIHSGSVIRKQTLADVFEPTGWYDFRLRCAEDYDLWLRICDKYIAYHIAEPLTYVRVHKNNATYSVKNEIWQQCWQLVQQKCQERYAKT